MGPDFIWTHKSRAEMERYFPQSWWPDFLPRFFNVDTLSRPRTQPPSKSLDWGFEGPALIARYLRETEFADVTAGISPLHLEALPPAPARA